MDNCPACNAGLDGQRVCRRCKAPVGKIMDVEKSALYHREMAIKAFGNHEYHLMFFHARRFRSLMDTPESTKLMASAAMLINRWDIAYFLWHWLKDA
ncbi:MAG: hypothetical protein HQK65_16105 [Desulfamplus sp.]|nr:hypothetical protein [Desulfamplus sp.]